MRKRRKQVRLFSIFTAFLMFFTLLTPGFTGAQSERDISLSMNDSKSSPQAKLSDRLLTEFDNEEKVTFLVKFKETADVKNVAKEARATAEKANLSAYQQEIAQRSSVVSELKATALESQADVKAFLEKELEKGNVVDIHSYFIVNGMAVTATKEIAEKIAAFAEVEKILPNEERQLIPAEKSDEVPENQLQNNIEWNVDRLNAPEVWQLGFDGQGTVVASLDSGADLYHPALERKYRGYDEETGSFDHTYSWFDPSEGDSYPTDGNGHGTHVTGTMVGSEADGTRQIGMAPGAEWIAVKVFDAAGSTTDAILLDGAEWILAPGDDVTKAPDVVNNSWSGASGIDEWYMDAVDAWRAAEIVPVFAAGNTTFFNPGGPGSVETPANYPQSFAVGATTIEDNLADFSLEGPSPYDEIKPDISAPGAGIISSVPGGGYDNYSGTSMAAPAVSGVVALLRSINGSLSVDDIETLLMETANSETGVNGTYPESPNNGFGYGITDAYAAAVLISGGLGTIQGQVTMDGEDREDPVYEHIAPAETYSGLDLDLTISASDNVSITSVELHYGDEVIEANRTSGDYKAGEYQVTVPGEDLEVGTFNYTWVINDFGNNKVVTDEYAVEVKSGITNGYFEDFESGNPAGWTLAGTNNVWEHGEPTSGPGEAYSGENLYATGVSGDYVSSMDATLIMPPIDVPADEESYLQFQSWHHFEYSSSTGRAWDYGQLVISTDLEEWTVLRPFEQEAEYWSTIEADLSDYQGERVYIGFYTYSDSSVTRPGWYIDDIALTNESIYDNDTEAPTYEHEAPAVTYEGAPLFLTIDVYDNARIGSATIHYVDHNNQSQAMEAELVEDNDVHGHYTVSIPTEAVTGDSISYYWTITDFAGNSVESDEYVVQIQEPITVGYFEDFEGDVVGWTSVGQNNAWELGVPTFGPGEAVSGENVYATNLSGDYPVNMAATLITPAINVPEGESYVQFKSWHHFEQNAFGTNWDNGYVRVSTDLEDWTNLQIIEGESEGWIDVEIDLSDYAGQQVYVGFYAYSDGSVTFPGWYIDDVAISDTLQGDEATNMTEEEMNRLVPTTSKEDKKKAETTPSAVTETNDGNVLEASDSSGIPLEAQVSVLETGRSTTTNPQDGSYTLLQEAGTYTVIAEAYGFTSAEQTVEVVEDEGTTANFVLEEQEKATVSGTISNALSGDAIEGATILLVEDANVEPVNSDEVGNFDLTAYLGEYTVKVIAQGYESKDVSITLDEDMNLDIELDPFFAVPGDEIGYDDGTAENARVFYEAGNGWAVKMSLPEGKNSAIVTDGVFQFHDADWPVPGDTPFAVEVWSAGDNGMPDERLAGPVEAEAIRDLNEWTVVDLSEHNIQVDGDFYMVYIQTQPDPNAPALATDEDGPNAERSYQYVEGSFEQAPLEDGNYMIRARVAYGMDETVITSPSDSSLTNESTITVEGTAAPETTVELYNNDEFSDSAEIGESGEFAVDVALEEGENSIVAHTLLDGELGKISDPITVTLDTVSPELAITSPQDGEMFNRETVTVEGTVTDEHLASVEVNGTETPVTDGTFSERILLDEGENTIEVVAYDLAGNTTTESVTVTTSFTGPIIENLTPTEDQHLGYGDTVMIEFDSEPGLEATFAVLMPLATNSELSSNNEFAMTETSEGHYVGSYTVSDVAAANGAVVEVKVKDDYGNEKYLRADGKLFLDPTVDRYSGDTRYETAVEISQEGWDSSDTVILARGDEYADALSGVPLATQLDAPILLTRSNELIASTKAEIERLGASEVIILGGTQAVSKSVEKELTEANLEVNRLSGETRYDTAAEIAKALTPEGTGQAVVVNGLDFPDALSVASYAANANMPILLTRDNELPTGTKNVIADLGITETIVVGGTQVVSDEVMETLPNAERLSGSDRYATNIAVAEGFEVDNKHMYVATGTNYVDALTGAVLAAKNDSGLLLVGNDVPEVVSNYVTRQGLVRLSILGGTVAVNDSIANHLLELMQ